MKKIINADETLAENIVIIEDMKKFNFSKTLPERFDFHYSNKIIDVGYRNVQVQGFVRIPFDIIYVIVLDSNKQKMYAPLMFTPQYQYIESVVVKQSGKNVTDELLKITRKRYVDYMKKTCQLNREESIKKVENLIAYYQTHKKEPEILVLPLQERQEDGKLFFSIFDGVHRAALSHIFGRETIKAYVALVGEPVYE